MKNEVYSWRLSSELKSDLDREARLRKLPVATVLETAVRDWLKRGDSNLSDGEAQRRLQAAATNCIGALCSGNPRRAETVRDTLRDRLSRCRAR